jgi:predicted FMN-binding regulatory protein PaiB
MLQAIVGVRMDVSAAHGKWKLSQNRAGKDAAGVMADLGARQEDQALAVRRAMHAVFREG